MRKADYQALAAELRQSLTDARRFLPDVAPMDHADPFTKGRIAAIEALARRLTFRLPVDRAQFLKACGIE